MADSPAAVSSKPTMGCSTGRPPGGGNMNAGTVFRLTLDGQETVVHFFDPRHGNQQPRWGLIQATDGALYGEPGYIFRFLPPSIVWSFDDSLCRHECVAAGPVTYGLDGALYGPGVGHGDAYVFRFEDTQP